MSRRPLTFGDKAIGCVKNRKLGYSSLSLSSRNQANAFFCVVLCCGTTTLAERPFKMTNPYDRILDLLGSVSSSDLKRLKLAVDELVANGYLPAQGYVEYRFITRSGKQYGPYKYRRLWQNGKLKDIYEGKASQDEYQDWLTQKASRKKALEVTENQ